MQATVAKTQIDVETIKGAIAAKMDSASFTSWIAPLCFEISDNVLTLVAQNQFSADFIKGVHINTLNAVAAEYGLAVNVCVRGARATTVANDNAQKHYTPSPADTAADASVFDAFVASEENTLVLAACKKIAQGPVSFSPLFIYGPSGSGKSLLADCIRGASGNRTIVMSGTKFVADFARALHDKNIFAFKDYCRDCDTFILDGVQALSGKRATCAEFLQLVIDLRGAGKNIVLISDCAPSALAGFERAARSLFASGLVADVAAPNADVRRQMLTRAGVPGRVAESLALRIASDGNLIGGVVNKIKMYSELTGAAVDIDVAGRLLSDVLGDTMTPVQMVRNMCEKLGVSYDAVCGSGRARALVMARQTMMAVLHGATRLSLAEIGNMVGGRDHASVVYALKQIEKQKTSDLVLSAQIDEMIAEFK